MGLFDIHETGSLIPPRIRKMGRIVGAATFGSALCAAAALTWGQVERRMPVVRRIDIPVPTSRNIQEFRILQVSDLHLYPGQEFLVSFLHKVANHELFDVVVSTGDNFGSHDGAELVDEAYEPLLHYPGAFVLGSHDYYASHQSRSWLRYLRRDPRLADQEIVNILRHDDETPSPSLPWYSMVDRFTTAGWLDLSNRAGDLKISPHKSPQPTVSHSSRSTGLIGTQHYSREDDVTRTSDHLISFIGVDDPHLERDIMPNRPNSWEDPQHLRIGVTHAPYRRVLDQFADMGADLVLAGHTHGGQIGIPGFGALVSNCDLPARYAKGTHIWRSPSGSETLLHVSAGLGTSPLAPVRIATRPEVSIIRIVPTQG